MPIIASGHYKHSVNASHARPHILKGIDMRLGLHGQRDVPWQRRGGVRSSGRACRSQLGTRPSTHRRQRSEHRGLPVATRPAVANMYCNVTVCVRREGRLHGTGRASRVAAVETQPRTSTEKSRQNSRCHTPSSSTMPCTPTYTQHMQRRSLLTDSTVARRQSSRGGLSARRAPRRPCTTRSVAPRHGTAGTP